MHVTKLSVVIPVYNEEATILSILDKIREVRLMDDIQKEVIVVNDCSTDQSEQMVLAYQ
ncbi:MAG: glycosyltransferase, partial [Planctomycetes bacterium]|nr:glycosyltransferase [Planctomycetota bacterium]